LKKGVRQIILKYQWKNHLTALVVSAALFHFRGIHTELKPEPLFCAEALRNVSNCRRLKLFFHIEAVKAFNRYRLKHCNLW